MLPASRSHPFLVMIMILPRFCAGAQLEIYNICAQTIKNVDPDNQIPLNNVSLPLWSLINHR